MRIRAQFSPLTMVSIVCAGALALGCSSSDRLKKQVSSLQTELTSLRADQDRLEERLAAVELSSIVAARAGKAQAPERVERPRLKVIHLAPEDGAPVAAPDHPADAEPSSARPVIRGTGDRVIKLGDDTSARSGQTSSSTVARLEE